MWQSFGLWIVLFHLVHPRPTRTNHHISPPISPTPIYPTPISPTPISPHPSLPSHLSPHLSLLHLSLPHASLPKLSLPPPIFHSLVYFSPHLPISLSIILPSPYFTPSYIPPIYLFSNLSPVLPPISLPLHPYFSFSLTLSLALTTPPTLPESLPHMRTMWERTCGASHTQTHPDLHRDTHVFNMAIYTNAGSYYYALIITYLYVYFRVRNHLTCNNSPEMSIIHVVYCIHYSLLCVWL